MKVMCLVLTKVVGNIFLAFENWFVNLQIDQKHCFANYLVLHWHWHASSKIYCMLEACYFMVIGAF